MKRSGSMLEILMFYTVLKATTSKVTGIKYDLKKA